MNKAQLDQLETRISNQLKEGDILFTSINAFLYRQVAQGTGSWCSHVGFAVKEDGRWMVIESAVPVVRKGPLRKFLAKTCNGEVSIRRLPKELTGTEIDALRQAANKRMGGFYHLGFAYESKRQFCSKFVHEVYKEALGVELGKVQTLRQLITENPQANLTFWRCWYFGLIPWQRKTLTPASQLHDPQLETVLCTVSG